MKTAIFGLLLCLCMAGCNNSSSGGGAEDPQNNLPPDPGEAGKATVEGIDSDGDGLRDDLQRYIALEYPDSAKKRAAVTQLATSLQEQLAVGLSKEKSTITAARTMRAVECISFIDPFHDIQSTADISDSLQAEVFNTKERWDAYRLFDEQLWGEVVASLPMDQQDASCDFDATALPN